MHPKKREHLERQRELARMASQREALLAQARAMAEHTSAVSSTDLALAQVRPL